MTKELNHLQNCLNGYITDTLLPFGWLESCKENLPVDINKNPLPWWTYPAIEFIATVIKPEYKVFEYGGGYSTLWWSKLVSRVITVDHNQNWVDKIAPKLSFPHQIISIPASQKYSVKAKQIADLYFQSEPKHEFPYDSAKITRRGLNDHDFIAYADKINEYDDNFDIVVIDGMARRLCSYFAINKLTDNGFIIFDNSNRSDYLEGYQYLIKSGFRQIRLWGNVPGATFPSCTSLFIKNLDFLSAIDFQRSLFNIPEY